jgi:hypothetical protein
MQMCVKASSAVEAVMMPPSTHPAAALPLEKAKAVARHQKIPGKKTTRRNTTAQGVSPVICKT